jgi:dTDP-4-dehydrorhamnose 3,5-epimerase
MLINGGIAVDDRGSVTFCNDFDFKDVKRFYMVSNHDKGFVRAWHGHKKEGKYAFVTKGAVKLAVVQMEGDTGATHILSATKPQILWIPPGYYNGFRTLTDDAQIIFFSTVTMEEAKDDDYRKPADTWELLNIEER